MILWDPARHFCSRWVDNSLEDDSLGSRVDSDNFCPVGGLAYDKVHNLFEMTETLWTLRKLVKNWFIYFSWVLIFRLFHKTDVRLSCPNHTGWKTAESQPKDLNNFGELAQFLVQIMACRVQLRLWQGGLVSASEKRREYSKLRIRLIKRQK